MNITQEMKSGEWTTQDLIDEITLPEGYGGTNTTGSTTIPCPPPSFDPISIPDPSPTLDSATIEQLVDELKDRGAREVNLKF